MGTARENSETVNSIKRYPSGVELVEFPLAGAESAWEVRLPNRAPARMETKRHAELYADLWFALRGFDPAPDGVPQAVTDDSPAARIVYWLVDREASVAATASAFDVDEATVSEAVAGIRARSDRARNNLC